MHRRDLAKLSIILMVFAIGLQLPALAGITNLLSNSSFENGSLDGWNNTSGIVITNQAHEGAKSALITSQTMRADINTSGGVDYKATAWVRILGSTGGENEWGGFRLEIQNGSGKTVAHSGWLLRRSHGTNWFKVALTFTADSAQSHLLVGYFGGPGRHMTACVDDIRVFAKPVSNTAPIITATLTPSHVSGLPQKIAFNVSFDDPDGAVRQVEWDFGDGGRSLSASGEHVAGVPGKYRAQVRVADDDGSVSSQTIDWTVAGSDFPSLTVTSPKDAMTVSDSTLPLSGSVNASAISVAATSDRGESATVSSGSSWSGKIRLHPGWNRLLFQAKDHDGHLVSEERRVRWVPSTPLGISEISENTNVVERWEILESSFSIKGSAATHTQFPYETNLPPGLEWVDGISVDAVFTPDNWVTTYRRPAFLKQHYERALKGNEEWMHPTGIPATWTVRFAPPALGNWKYRIEVRESKGTARSAERSFEVIAPANPLNHGPVRVAKLDSRYFEHEDGTLFLGNGHGMGANDERYSFDAQKQFAAQGDNNDQFFRFWIAGHLWGSAWQPWNSRTLGYNGTVPATGLSLESAYANGLASLKLDSKNPIMFQGFMSGHPAVIPGHTYRLRVRWRTEEITGPAKPDQPYGACVRLVGWPESGQTHTSPLAICHVIGTTPWHVAETNFVAAGAFIQNGNFLANPALVLENTTSGRAFVDEVSVREVLPDGSLGGEILRSPQFNSYMTYDPRRSAGLDTIFADAAKHGKYIKLVISEKQEDLLNWWSASGLPDPLGDHFFERKGPGHRLHEYYWRHLFARFGAFRSIHSWETVNEQNPNDPSGVALTADLAVAAAADGNPKLASTSTWTTLATNTWKQPSLSKIPFTDFHCYVRGTGWIEPKLALANDSARFFHEYDSAARAADFGKPVVWGEQGIDGNGGTDGQEPLLAKDKTGIWLHKIIWARTGPGGAYPLYWYTDNIEKLNLHPIYGTWNRFMSKIPLNNGHYVDAQAACSSPDARAWGQKDLTARRAHLWVDNARHTWRAVVDGASIPPVSTTVTIPMGVPNAHFVAKWFNTGTGMEESSQPLTANSEGQVILSVTNLAADTAVQLYPKQ